VTVRGRTLPVLVALAAVAACGNPATPVGEDAGLEKLLPAVSNGAEWSLAEGPLRYTPETLYEYVNGGAERYLGFGFRELVHVRYRLGDEPLAGVTLDLYDMGSELGAFGIYSAGRPPGVEVRPWGTEGYRVGTIAAAWRGALFVHGEADDERPELAAMLERMMAEVGERAPGPRSQPAVLDLLPQEGRVAHSERYVAADLEGHAFLPGGVIAVYEVDGARSELFVSDLGNEAAAADALEQLRGHLARWGRVEDEPLALGDGAFRYTDPTLGAGTAVRSGRFVAGIQGDLSAEHREAVMAAVVAKLQ
jgi:hypothetical protein